MCSFIGCIKKEYFINNHKLHSFLTAAALIFIALFCSACQPPQDFTDDPPTPTPETNIFTASFGSSIAPWTYTEAVKSSEIIIVAINIARNPDDLSQPGDFIGVGRIYELAVERYLQGAGQKSVNIVAYEGDIFDSAVDIESIPAADLEAARLAAGIPQLVTAQRYIFFLNQLPQAYQDASGNPLWAAPGFPAVFTLTPSNCVQPFQPVPPGLYSYPARSLAEFEALLQDPAAFEPQELAYPASDIPANLSLCPDAPLNPSLPYP